MPQLDFSIFPSQFFWLAVSFFTMLLVFSFFIIPKTAEMINLRKTKIDEYLEKAADLKTKIEKTLDKYNQALKKTTEEANLSIAETKEEMDALIDRRQMELSANMKKQQTENEAKINAGKEKVFRQLEPMVVELTQDVLQTIGFKNIKPADITRIVQQTKEK